MLITSVWKILQYIGQAERSGPIFCIVFSDENEVILFDVFPKENEVTSFFVFSKEKGENIPKLKILSFWLLKQRDENSADR